MTHSANLLGRRDVVFGGLSLLFASALAGGVARARAVELAVIDVAYAGSMGSLMEGPIKTAVASRFGLDIHGRAQGSNALANLIAGGSIRPDVFIAITPGPMRIVMRAGKAKLAEPIARTDMVIAYSPKSRFAPQFDSARKTNGTVWAILQQPGLRFGRTDPVADPQGRNIIFTVMLAAKLYRQPDLVAKVLGPAINERQIFSEPTLLARLQSGQLDACAAYKTQPGPFNLPYIELPEEINLSSEDVREQDPGLKLTINERVYYPEPLIFYASVLNEEAQPNHANEFVQWLKSSEAQSIFRRFQYDPPGGASTLRA